MPLIYNTFDSAACLALADRLDAYLHGLGDEMVAKVVTQESKEVKGNPLVVVSCTELEEVVYQTGHYRAGLEVTVKVDADAGSPDQIRRLTGAVLDCLQQTDLISQMNSVQDETGRALVVVQLVVLNQSRMEDVGDRQWRRVIAFDVFGFNPA